MIFKRLELTNWIPYRDASIKFASGKKNVTLIRGNNKGGKTAIMRAIKWSLYGNTGDVSAYKYPLDLLNTDARNEGDFNCSVRLILEKNKEEVVVERALVLKSSSNQSPSNSSFEVNFTVLKNGKSISEDNDSFIKEMLSEEISDFFLFDGELLKNYQKLSNRTQDAKVLKNNIEKVIRTPYLISAKNEMMVLEKAISDKIANNTADVQLIEINDTLNQLLDYKKDFEDQISLLKESLSTENERYDNAKSDRDAYGVLNDDVDSLIKAEGRVDDLKKAISVAKEDLNNNFLYASKYVFSEIIKKKQNNLINELKNLNRAKDSMNTVKVLKELLNESINSKNNICAVCSQDISEIETLKIKLEDLNGNESTDLNLISNKIEDIGSILSFIKFELPTSFEDLSSKLNDSIHEQMMNNINIENLTKNTAGMKNDSAAAQIKMDQSNTEIIELEAGIEDLQTEIFGPNATKQVGSYGKEGIQAAIDRAQTLKDKLELTLPPSDLKDLQDKYKALINVFRHTIDDLSNSVKKEIEKTANSINKKMTVELTQDTLKINDLYGLDVIDGNGNSKQTSAAGDQIVALSLLHGLKKSTGIEGPLLIDTPFARIDLDHREKMLQVIPEMSKQCILLVHSGEISRESELEAVISPKVGAWIEIFKEDNSNESKLVAK